jgi:hypothetical protein
MDPHNPQNAIIESAAGLIGSQIVLGETMDSGPRTSERIQDDGTDNQLWSEVWRRNSAGEFPLSELGVNGKRAIRLADFVRLYETAMDKEIDYHDYLLQLYPDACSFVSVSLPGYSGDGRQAIVCVQSGWVVYHAAYWTYVLRRTQTGWVVEKRAFKMTE